MSLFPQLTASCKATAAAKQIFSCRLMMNSLGRNALPVNKTNASIQWNVCFRTGVVSRTFSSSTSAHIGERVNSENQQHQQQQHLSVRPLRRCLLSVPGHDPRKVQKAFQIQPDTIVLDLEDGVAGNQKDEARELVQQTLLTLDDQRDDLGHSTILSEMCVRINGLETGDLALHDLEAVLPCRKLQAIVVPKVETAADIHFVQDQIQEHCTGNVRIIAAVESAMGILNLREIAETATVHGGKLDALVFASEDYMADMEGIRTSHGTELLYARSKLVTTAKAYGLQAIDMVHIDFRDLQALEQECLGGVQLGFTGKQAIHPNQVPIIQQSFVPSAKDVDFATRAIQQYESSTANGVGACVVDGIVVDLPVYKWCCKIMERAGKPHT
ncbi:citrate lyase beta subunit [Nitzschia inconspicua]|uniref:Citrate lyase beta subunit n=1 Tax=Nitzschia inconspicua TaxID=303405 RepID=A0A9K3KV17_9STRA|nr:citrate lyase beta subunit [Nitzschia inconspicua]